MFLIVWSGLDPDFGWHLQAGRYILHHGIPSHDIYTYTARNYRWIDHEWFSDIIMATIYGGLGYLGTSIFFAGLWSSALMASGQRWLATLVLATVALSPYVGIRPMVWTVLGLAVLIRLTTRHKPQPKLILFIPLMFLIWANLHGGFVIGFVYLAFLFVKERHFIWLKILLLSALATFINPYGPRLYYEILTTTLDTSLHHQISEWRSFLIFWPTQAFISIWIAGALMYSGKKLTNWFTFDKILFILGLSSSRNLVLFVMASMPSLEDYLRQTQKSIPKKLRTSARIVLAGVIMTVVFDIVFCAYMAFGNWPPRYNNYPKKATIYLQSHPCRGNLFNAYNFGGYLIWKLPNQPVYIDGRMPSWRNQDNVKYFDIFQQIYDKDEVRKSEFEKYNIRCVLVPNDKRAKPLIDKLEKEGWQSKVSDAHGTLLEQPI